MELEQACVCPEHGPASRYLPAFTGMEECPVCAVARSPTGPLIHADCRAPINYGKATYDGMLMWICEHGGGYFVTMYYPKIVHKLGLLMLPGRCPLLCPERVEEIAGLVRRRYPAWS